MPDNLLDQQVNNSKDVEGLVINPSIKKEAEDNIKDLKEFEHLNRGIQIYESKVTLEFYENDSLVLSTNDNPKKHSIQVILFVDW